MTTPVKEIDATELRERLTDVLANIDTSGPIRVLRYGKPVAELRPVATNGMEREALKALREAEAFFADIELTEPLDDLGYNTATQIIDLHNRFAAIERTGIKFTTDAGFALGTDEVPPGSTLSPEELIHRAALDEQYPKTLPPAEAAAWADVLVELLIEALKTDPDACLPHSTWDNTDDGRLAATAAAQGMTPASFRDHALAALAKGVALKDLDEIVGDESVPADILTLPHFSNWTLGKLTAAGLPHAEACKVFALNLDTGDAGTLAEAGIRTAQDIRDLLESGINPGMVVRAHQNGRTVEQWREEVQLLAPYRYKIDGSLPWDCLVEAAREGLSLATWDRRRRDPWYTGADILTLARAKVGHGYARAVENLLRPWGATREAGVELACWLKARRFNTDALEALSRSKTDWTPQGVQELATALPNMPKAHAEALAFLADTQPDMLSLAHRDVRAAEATRQAIRDGLRDEQGEDLDHAVGKFFIGTGKARSVPLGAVAEYAQSGAGLSSAPLSVACHGFLHARDMIDRLTSSRTADVGLLTDYGIPTRRVAEACERVHDLLHELREEQITREEAELNKTLGIA